MTKITTMKILRNKVLQAFEDFEDGKIDSAHLSALSKASEAIISGLRSEMQYAVLTNQQPSIPFYGDGSGIPLTDAIIKKLL